MDCLFKDSVGINGLISGTDSDGFVSWKQLLLTYVRFLTAFMFDSWMRRWNASDPVAQINPVITAKEWNPEFNFIRSKSWHKERLETETGWVCVIGVNLYSVCVCVCVINPGALSQDSEL